MLKLIKSPQEEVVLFTKALLILESQFPDYDFNPEWPIFTDTYRDVITGTIVWSPGQGEEWPNWDDRTSVGYSMNQLRQLGRLGKTKGEFKHGLNYETAAKTIDTDDGKLAVRLDTGNPDHVAFSFFATNVVQTSHVFRSKNDDVIAIMSLDEGMESATEITMKGWEYTHHSVSVPAGDYLLANATRAPLEGEPPLKLKFTEEYIASIIVTDGWLRGIAFRKKSELPTIQFNNSK